MPDFKVMNIVSLLNRVLISLGMPVRQCLCVGGIGPLYAINIENSISQGFSIFYGIFLSISFVDRASEIFVCSLLQSALECWMSPARAGLYRASCR